MTTVERIVALVENLDQSQQERILRLAERLTHTPVYDRDQLLAMSLRERAQAMEAMLASASFDDYEFFEANDPIYDYDSDAGNYDHSANAITKAVALVTGFNP